MATRAAQHGGGHDLTAIGLVLLAGLLFVSMNTCVKLATPVHGTGMLLWARYFFHVAIVVLIFPNRVTQLLRQPQLKVQLTRSVLLLLSTCTSFLALSLMPIGQVAAITFSTPLIVAALAVAMLKEHVSWRRWAVILVGFLGTLLVVHPGAGDFNLGALAALACAFVYALYQVSTRMVREAEPIVTLLFGGLVGMVVISLAAPLFWRWPTLSGWAVLVLIGLLGALGHLCMIVALQRGEASRISPYTYAQLLWATLSGFVVFGDVPNALTLAGAGVIVACGLYIRRLDRAERGYGISGGVVETSRR